VNGEKIWISTAQVANKMLLLARTTPLEEVKRKTEGLSLFYTSLDRSKIDVRLIHKMGRHAVDSNELFIEDLWVPEEDRRKGEGTNHPPASAGFDRAKRSASPRRNPSRPLRAADRIQPADRHERGIQRSSEVLGGSGQPT
jgi:alkylation response protein AidB-like acyl-CoA dehydrogenase